MNKLTEFLSKHDVWDSWAKPIIIIAFICLVIRSFIGSGIDGFLVLMLLGIIVIIAIPHPFDMQEHRNRKEDVFNNGNN